MRYLEAHVRDVQLDDDEDHGHAQHERQDRVEDGHVPTTEIDLLITYLTYHNQVHARASIERERVRYRVDGI